MTIQEIITEADRRANRTKVIGDIYFTVERKMEEETMRCEYNEETKEYEFKPYDEDYWNYEEVQKKKEVYNEVLELLKKIMLK